MCIANLLLAAPMLDKVWRQLGAHGLLVMIVVALCVLGLVVILLLLRTWRRYNARLNRTRAKRRPMVDIWHAAADRLDETDQPEVRDDRPDPDEHDRDDADER